MIGIVVSRADEASVAIGDALLDLADWEERTDADRRDAEGGGTYHVRDGFERREFDGLHLYLADVAAAFDDPDLVAFVSRHAGETGPLLTAHFPGNVGPADHGGEPNQLPAAAPAAQKAVVAALAEHAPDGYDVGMECTHHGPSSVGAPAMFVEVGSAESEWRDPAAAEAAARAVLALAGVEPTTDRTVVGVGGGHYAPRFSRIVRETDWAVGHVLADWAIEAAGGLPDAVLERAFAASGTDRAVVAGERADLVAAVEAHGFAVVSETWVRETTGVPLPLVERVESTLGAVDDGVRFGERRADDHRVEAVHPDLVAAAVGADRPAAIEAVAAATVAYATAEGGNRPTGRVLVPADAGLDPVVDGLCVVLDRDGVTVEREGDRVVLTEQSFDPDKARSLGVPEGPAFGRLSAGEPVEVDGESILPEAVHTTRTRRLPIRAADA